MADTKKHNINAAGPSLQDFVQAGPYSTTQHILDKQLSDKRDFQVDRKSSSRRSLTISCTGKDDRVLPFQEYQKDQLRINQAR
jgi:hypothetical protein